MELECVEWCKSWSSQHHSPGSFSRCDPSSRTRSKNSARSFTHCTPWKMVDIEVSPVQSNKIFSFHIFHHLWNSDHKVRITKKYSWWLADWVEDENGIIVVSENRALLDGHTTCFVLVHLIMNTAPGACLQCINSNHRFHLYIYICLQSCCICLQTLTSDLNTWRLPSKFCHQICCLQLDKAHCESREYCPKYKMRERYWWVGRVQADASQRDSGNNVKQ